ncbi:ribosomal RNA-processing protein 7 homolog A isoform X3 [Agelaius tricolor]|uniref:ribosomal RNA-processing protein 7 homolog A isoform X3 n=1 Tax=Agelaius phoeniceus TaxID=39638 RepID=UPI0023ECE08E|nr:ribosomal RNA-processing protein 7 homolog A isoform X6 [Agelaius phoeniceus]
MFLHLFNIYLPLSDYRHCVSFTLNLAAAASPAAAISGAAPRPGNYSSRRPLRRRAQTRWRPPRGVRRERCRRDTRDSLSRLFSRCGHVQSVDICDKPGPGEKKDKLASKFFDHKTLKGFQVAYVVFRKPAAVQAAKALSQEGPLLISTESHPVKTGISKWIASYEASIVDPKELKAEVDAYMQDYDKKVAEEEAKAAMEEGVPDEEGWVKVTRKGRKPGLPRTEAANLRVLEKEKQKRARKELLNFYAWQHRETKREHIAQLRKKFEEDKQRIALMRAQRKFRPY